MSQNLVDLKWDSAHWDAIDASLADLERLLAELVSFKPKERRRLVRLGARSEAFCREAVSLATDHARLLTRQFDLEGFQRDLTNRDELRRRFVRLNFLHERMMDTDIALGSDLMSNSLECYALLKLNGKESGLERVRLSLASRFQRQMRDAQEDLDDPDGEDGEGSLSEFASR